MLSHRFKPMPTASVATKTLHLDRGSLKRLACWMRVAEEGSVGERDEGERCNMKYKPEGSPP